jgi:hypothetical protein
MSHRKGGTYSLKGFTIELLNTRPCKLEERIGNDMLRLLEGGKQDG